MAQAAPLPPGATTVGSRRRSSSRAADSSFRWGSLVIAFGLIALLGLLLWVLLAGGWESITKFGFSFVTGRDWNPVTQAFGALPFIFGTIVTSVIAIVLAVPVSVGLALLLNEVESGWLRNPMAVFVDLLAAIPSVIYGLWALFILVPIFDKHVEPFLAHTIGHVPVIGALFQIPGGGKVVTGGNLFVAGVVLAIMVIPIVTAVTREVIAIVPHDLREAAKGLGATRYETIRMAVLPYARSGIVGATMLGLGRALGETIAVALVVGNGLGIGASLFRAGYTIPAVIANEFREATLGVHRAALLELALILVVISLIMAALSRLLVGRTAALVGSGPASAIEAGEAAGIVYGANVGLGPEEDSP
jgi:phosphate transport system permease protein